MSFKFGPQTKKGSVKVGYIDPTRGYISGVSVCEANIYAKNNPGITFIFIDGDANIKYFNINEVNALTENDVVSSTDECGGLQTYEECTSPEIVIYGGGGVGAYGNPVIGIDGSLLAVDLVSGGFGYQYPPLASAVDNCQIGNGATLQTVLGTVVDTVEGGAPFETYEECPEDAVVEYGRIYDRNGQDIGEWNPSKYLPVPGEDPILLEIEQFQESLKNPWWTTRDNKPLKITADKETFSSNDVTSPLWADFEFLNTYAVSPVDSSDVPGSDNAGKIFIFEWQEDFPTTGKYVFRSACDNLAKLYIDNLFVANINSFNPTVITKEIQEGIHTIRVDLLNLPVYESVTSETQPVGGYFHLKGDGYYLRVGGNERVQLSFKLDWSGTGNPSETAVTKITIPTEEGPSVVLERTKQGNEFTVTGTTSNSGIFQANNDYGPIIFEGVTGRTAPKIINVGDVNVDPNTFQQAIEFQDSNDSNLDVDARLDIIGNSGVQLSGPRIVQSAQTVLGSSGNSTQSNIETQNVFNTSDYIDRADRTLWRTASNASSFSSLLNNYGVAPFDSTTEQAKTDSYPGTHKIVWSGITFPVSGDYIIELASDDDAVLTINDIVIEHKGFRGPGVPNADSSTIKYITAGKYDIVADLSQISGGSTRGLGNGNPMSIAVNINVSFTQEKVRSSLSWNQNPMGIAMIIEQPPKAVPQDILPVSSPCPPNPIWSTRFPGSSQQWYPVNHPSWADFFNRYAISPVLPLDTPGSDGSGIVYTNYWDVEMPFRGVYEFQVQRDNTARIYVDGNLAFDIKTSGDSQWVSGGLVNKVKSQQIFLESGLHRISVELENKTAKTLSTITQKIFSTKDWKEVAGEEPEFVDVTFSLKNSGEIEDSVFAFTSEDGLDSFTLNCPKERGDTATVTRGLKVGTKYNVSASSPSKDLEQGLSTSDNDETREPSNKIFADAVGSNNDNNDFTVVASSGIFTSSNKTSIGGGGRTTFTITYEPQSPPVVEFVTETRNGVTYSGPPLFPFSLTTGGVDGTGWGDFMNEYSTSPKTFREINQPDDGINGVFVLTWKGVSFPETGTYRVKLSGDNEAVLKSDGVELLRSSDFLSDKPNEISVNFTAGTHDIVVELQNVDDGIDVFETNPMGVSLLIEKDISILVENTGADWQQNPMGISAILVPPPCILKTGGKGVVADVIVTDPGNGYIPPSPTNAGYPVLLELSEIIVDNPGINYSCGVDQIQIVPDLGANPTYTCDSFGRIQSVQVAPTAGYTVYPSITMPSNTGVNASFRPVFRVVRDPLPQPEEIIQVTDLVGLKQTGYVDGRAYYGAVYYENGIRFAGYYKTIGTPIRVYDTLQESITAEVTTVPSAIQRSGTDITNNDPTLNIPGTPQNLT